MVKKAFPVIFILLITFVSISSLLNYGLPPTHDGEYHIMRFWQFYANIKEGIFYPRWAPDFNNGYGIPLFNYVYPLPNYVASLFLFLGFGLIQSLKLNFIVASFIGAFFFYLWSRRYWGEIGGVVSSIFYTFSPYHFLDIYVRGSVGEVWSLAIFPGLLWAFYSYYETKSRKFFILSSVFLSLLILSHNILALVFTPILALYALFVYWGDKKRKISELINIAIIFILGLGLSAPFWIPAIFEIKYVSGLQIFFPTQNFPKLYQLIYSSWGYGFSGTKTIGAEGQMSFQIGLANLLAVALSIVIAFRTHNKSILFFLALFFILVFLITPFSALFWDNLPLISYIQFPWRLLSGVILAASFLAGGLASEKIVKQKNKRALFAVFLISVSVFLSYRYAKAPFYHPREDSHYLTRDNFTSGTNSPGDLFNTRWLKKVPAKKSLKVIDGSINVIDNKVNEKMYIINTQKEQIFYPKRSRQT